MRYLRKIDTYNPKRPAILGWNLGIAVLGNLRECDASGKLILPKSIPYIDANGTPHHEAEKLKSEQAVLDTLKPDDGSMIAADLPPVSSERSYFREAHWLPNYMIDELESSPDGIDIMGLECKFHGFNVSTAKSDKAFKSVVATYKLRRKAAYLERNLPDPDVAEAAVVERELQSMARAEEQRKARTVTAETSKTEPFVPNAPVNTTQAPAQIPLDRQHHALPDPADINEPQKPTPKVEIEIQKPEPEPTPFEAVVAKAVDYPDSKAIKRMKSYLNGKNPKPRGRPRKKPVEQELI